MLNGIFDGGEGTDDTLVIGNFLIGVKWNIEVDLATCKRHRIDR